MLLCHVRPSIHQCYIWLHHGHFRSWPDPFQAYQYNTLFASTRRIRFSVEILHFFEILLPWNMHGKLPFLPENEVESNESALASSNKFKQVLWLGAAVFGFMASIRVAASVCCCANNVPSQHIDRAGKLQKTRQADVNISPQIKRAASVRKFFRSVSSMKLAVDERAVRIWHSANRGEARISNKWA